MSKYGIPYQGSKNQIANWIINLLPSGKRFVDLFGGGFAVSHCALLSNKYDNVYYNELNPLLVDLIKKAISGEFNYKNFNPEWITREKFNELKDKDGYIKYIWSFGNAGNTYLFGKNIENYKRDLHNAVVFNNFSGNTFIEYPEFKNIKGSTITERRSSIRKIIKTINNTSNKFRRSLEELQNLQKLQRLQQLERLERLQQLERIQDLQQLEKISQLEINCGSYLDYQYQEGDIIYCDPPYENTFNYNKQDFNHKEFYDWVASRPYQVFFSSYEISDNRFKIVDCKQKRSIMSSTNNSTFKNEFIYINNYKGE